MTRKTVALLTLLAAFGLVAGQALAGKTPQVKTQLSLGFNPSPLQDYLNFSGGLASQQRGCATRTIEIRHADDNSLVTRVHPDAPFKNNGRFSAFFDTDFVLIAGNFEDGERVRASAAKRKLKQGGKVTAVCKPSSKTITLALSS